jgi:hypothetical protein
VLKRRNFTRYPLPDRIIKKVNDIGKREKQGRELRFTDRNREAFDWTDVVEEEDDTFQGLLDNDAPFPDVPAEMPGVDMESEVPVVAVEDEDEPEGDEAAAAALENADINPADILEGGGDDGGAADANAGGLTYEVHVVAPDDEEEENNAYDSDDESAAGILDLPDDGDDRDDDSPAEEMVQEPRGRGEDGRSLRLRGTRPNYAKTPGVEWPRTAGVKFADEEWPVDDVEPCNVDPEMIAQYPEEAEVFGYLMTQYTLKRALRKFGDRAEEAAMAEMKQLHVMDCWEPKDPTQLSREDKRNALSCGIPDSDDGVYNVRGRDSSTREEAHAYWGRTGGLRQHRVRRICHHGIARRDG